MCVFARLNILSGPSSLLMNSNGDSLCFNEGHTAFHRVQFIEPIPLVHHSKRKSSGPHTLCPCYLIRESVLEIGQVPDVRARAPESIYTVTSLILLPGSVNNFGNEMHGN